VHRWSAPDGPFDAAACLLTLHFLAQDERRQTVREVYRRLIPGAPSSSPITVFRIKVPTKTNGLHATPRSRLCPVCLSQAEKEHHDHEGTTAGPLSGSG